MKILAKCSFRSTVIDGSDIGLQFPALTLSRDGLFSSSFQKHFQPLFSQHFQSSKHSTVTKKEKPVDPL